MSGASPAREEAAAGTAAGPVGSVTHLVVDSVDPYWTARFWGRVLGMPVGAREDGWVDLGPVGAHGPVLSFQQVPERKTVKNRVHLDIGVADLDAARMQVQLLGATPAGEVHAGQGRPWQVFRDPDGNEFCLVTVAPSVR